MRIRQALLALVAVGTLWGEPVPKVDKDEFLHHVQTWQLPEYPRKSASAGRTGVVIATVDVDGRGHVTAVNIVSSPDVHMGETVKSVVGQWIFRPFSGAGDNKPAESTIYIEFRLQPMGPNVIIPGLTSQPEQTIKATHTHPQV